MEGIGKTAPAQWRRRCVGGAGAYSCPACYPKPPDARSEKRQFPKKVLDIFPYRNVFFFSCLAPPQLQTPSTPSPSLAGGKSSSFSPIGSVPLATSWQGCACASHPSRSIFACSMTLAWFARAGRAALCFTAPTPRPSARFTNGPNSSSASGAISSCASRSAPRRRHPNLHHHFTRRNHESGDICIGG